MFPALSRGVRWLLIYTRKILLVIVDFILISLSIYIGLVLRFDGEIPELYASRFVNSFAILAAVNVLIYFIFGIYHSLWRNASVDELFILFFATVSASIVDLLIGYGFDIRLPRSVYIISCLLALIFIGGFRMSYRVLRRLKNVGLSMHDKRKRVMVIGGGDAGSMVIKELKTAGCTQYQAVAVIDDDRWKQKLRIHGVPIKGGREKICEIAEKDGIDEIIIALPSVDRKEVSEILDICKKTKCKLKTLPGVYEIINGKVGLSQIRDVSIDDLLGRDEVKLDMHEASGYLKSEVVLVTGGGGSIGSELCRQIARFKPKKLIILDIYENNAYDLQNELLQIYKNDINLEVVIATVRDRKRLRQVFETYRPGVVFHAAAHKHVPLMEANSAEAVKNNIFGTLNTAQCADEFGVKRFVLISTDKAVNPTNIMGATKRVAEMIIQSLDKISKTEFVAVRFGNVLGSNGSVIPLFKKQIANGGPVTVTHPEITRFFMTIPEAARLVLQAGAMARGGEIFILDMGKPVKIVDLARDLIRLSGFEPDKDIKIEFTGLRPGEKLYEELLLAEEGIQATRHDKIFIGKPLDIEYMDLMEKLRKLEVNVDDPEKLRETMAMVVPTYNYAREEVAAAGI